MQCPFCHSAFFIDSFMFAVYETASSTELTGWLKKKGGIGWKHRYFQLKGSKLKYVPLLLNPIPLLESAVPNISVWSLKSAQQAHLLTIPPPPRPLQSPPPPPGRPSLGPKSIGNTRCLKAPKKFSSGQTRIRSRARGGDCKGGAGYILEGIGYCVLQLYLQGVAWFWANGASPARHGLLVAQTRSKAPQEYVFDHGHGMDLQGKWM